MASLRLHGGGGYESFSAAAVASSSDQRGCVGHQNRFFPNKNNIKKKNLLISKENQTPNHQHKKAQSHRCCSTASVAANWPAGDKGRAVIPSCDHAYAADHWTEVISKFAANKRMVVDKEEKKEEDYSSQKLDRWMRDSVVEFEMIPDPDLPGHLLLEQYQAQLVSAVRTALGTSSGPILLEAGLQLATKILTNGIISGDQIAVKRIFSLISPLNNFEDLYYPSFTEWVSCKVCVAKAIDKEEKKRISLGPGFSRFAIQSFVTCEVDSLNKF